jgi:hypothetical protein
LGHSEETVDLRRPTGDLRSERSSGVFFLVEVRNLCVGEESVDAKNEEKRKERKREKGKRTS